MIVTSSIRISIQIIWKPNIYSNRHERSNQKWTNDFFYRSTLCQLILIFLEVVVSLVIIFYNEIGHDNRSNNGYRLVQLIPYQNRNGTILSKFTSKCQTLFTLKFLFIILISISFLLRIVTSTLRNVWTLYSNDEHDQIFPLSTAYISNLINSLLAGTWNISAINYTTSIIEFLLFILVLSTSVRVTYTGISSIDQ
ncbi:hypothetical protein RDWZM_004095 [Blomia tropicalis]|uniref:Uncharacterized protein n=1 Tax=Blomia tropicalis TaxID=40697 RepID=A0A9Q0RTB1_BLOTA|nr:hypothetical protein RDWZM_004095 [Blomia tropicalis]